MNDKEKEELRNKIVEMIGKYETDITDLEKMTQPIGPENAIGRVSRMDAINNKGVMEAALRNKISKKNKLMIALENIDKDGFGYCGKCHKPINLARLMFMPESTSCVRCAD